MSDQDPHREDPSSGTPGPAQQQIRYITQQAAPSSHYANVAAAAGIGVSEAMRKAVARDRAMSELAQLLSNGNELMLAMSLASRRCRYMEQHHAYESVCEDVKRGTIVWDALNKTLGDEGDPLRPTGPRTL